MMEQYTEVEKILADIRNKLTPHWNTVEMVIKEYNKFDTIKEAKAARDQEMYILQQLDKLLEYQYTEQDMQEAWYASGDYQSVPKSPNWEKWIEQYKQQSTKQ